MQILGMVIIYLNEKKNTPPATTNNNNVEIKRNMKEF